MTAAPIPHHGDQVDRRHPAIQGFNALLSFTLYHLLWLGFLMTTVLVLYNSPGIYRREAYATQVLLYALGGGEIGVAAVLAAIPWGVICVVCLVVTIGTIVYTIATGNDPIGWLSREINRLSALCPLFGPSPLGWSAWLECRATLAAFRTVYWAWVIAGVISLINVLVFLGPLTRGIPSGPLPPLPF